MEGYKLFKDAVEDASKGTTQWKYAGDGSIFSKQEMLAMADVFDEQFSIGGWNYFLAFPDGEIDILATEDNSVERMFLPLAAAEEQTAKAEAGPKFCAGCGTKLDTAAKFCPKCGKKIG